MELERLRTFARVDRRMNPPATGALPSANADKQDKPDPKTQLSQARLVMKRDAEQGRWIYKAVDANTGELLSQVQISSIWDFVRLGRNGVICDVRA